jgi:hypothetical protein
VLNGVFALIDAEAADSLPGQEAVLSRLLEIVLIELMRSPELLLEQQRGMLAGLIDPQIGRNRRRSAGRWSLHAPAGPDET